MSFDNKILGEWNRLPWYVRIGVATVLAAQLNHSALWAMPTYYNPDLGNSASGIGQGGIDGFENNAAAIFGNPAGLQDTCLGVNVFSVSFMAGDVQYYSIATGLKISPSISMGVGATQLGTTGIPTTALNSDNEIVQTGSYGYANRKAVVTTAFHPVPDWTWGLSAIAYDKRLATVSGRGYDASLGVMWTPQEKPYQVLFGITNVLGSNVNYSNQSAEKLATQFSVSGAWGPVSEYPIKIMGQLMAQNLPRFSISKSVGIAYFLTQQRDVYVVGGLHDTVDQGVTRLTPSLGVVANVGTVQFAYSLNPVDPVDQSIQQSVSVALRFPDMTPILPQN